MLLYHIMSKKCDLTGQTGTTGGGYANRTRATVFTPIPKKRKQVNLQKKKVIVDGKTYNLTLSTRAIKTINKNGAKAALKKAGLLKTK